MPCYASSSSVQTRITPVGVRTLGATYVQSKTTVMGQQSKYPAIAMPMAMQSKPETGNQHSNRYDTCCRSDNVTHNVSLASFLRLSLRLGLPLKRDARSGFESDS